LEDRHAKEETFVCSIAALIVIAATLVACGGSGTHATKYVAVADSDNGATAIP